MAALGSLGQIAARLPKSTSREAHRIGGAFLRGKKAKGSCVVGKPQDCHYSTDGRELLVRGKVVAKRSAPNTDTIEVCLNPRATAEERGAASVIMRGLRAGIGVKTAKDEQVRITGRKGRSGTAWPGGCVQVHVPKKLRVKAAAAITKELVSSLGPAPKPKKASKAKAPAKKAKKAGKKKAKK